MTSKRGLWEHILRSHKWHSFDTFWKMHFVGLSEEGMPIVLLEVLAY
jgi:hypothetical protein